MSAGSPTEEFGPYIVYEQLGVGGMAQVHRAIEVGASLPRPIALKRMLSHIAGSEEMVKSFVREARLASYLKHKNVAQTYDLGRVGEIYFIVMELITGRNLREVLRHCGATTGPMPVPVALNILNQICDALDYAHNLRDEGGRPLGIIHRDVSPSNIIVSDNGIVKLIDFGIAKASGAGMQTLGGTLKGKFGYMAPEYIAGRIDARADLFAVGVIAHELLTNRPLFSGRDDIDTLTRVRDMHIDPPSKKNAGVPPEIDDIVMTALARDPDRRWQHATALRTALTTLTHRLGLVATNTQTVQWIDWAFTHQAPAKRERREADTETDARPSYDEGSIGDPSISIEPLTAQLVSMNQKATLVDARPPAVKTPLGTPAYMATRPSGRPHPMPILPLGTPGSVADPGSGRTPVPTARSTGNATVPMTARASSQMRRSGSPSAAPPIAHPQVMRPSRPSQPMPMAGELARPSRPSQPIAIEPPARASRPSQPPPILGEPSRSEPPTRGSRPSQPPPLLGPAIAARPGSPSQPPPLGGPARSGATLLASSAPVPVPSYASTGQISAQTGPQPSMPPSAAVARPARPSSPPPVSHAGHNAALDGSSPRVVAPPAAAPAASTQSSHLLAMVLVVLAAAIAAITVYIVLLFLT